MWDRWLDREDRENYRAAVVASVIINTKRGRKKALSPRDIIPSLRDRRIMVDDDNTLEDQVAALKMMFGADALEVHSPEESPTT